MKIVITLLLLVSTQISWSQAKTSVSDGDWYNPQTWNPPNVPLSEDSVIINHEVTAESITEVWINHLIIGSTGILDSDTIFALHGSLKLNGELYADTFAIGDGTYFINNDVIEVSTFLLGYTEIHENYGEIIVADTFVIAVDFLNASGATIEAYHLITSDNFENNGKIDVDNWFNDATINGQGSICIENCFQNSGNIGGSLDVCDATPNSGFPCDFDFGTIAPTVTMCAIGPCSEPAGITDENVSIDVIVSPNPSTDGHFDIQTDAEIINIEVIDLMGRVLFEKSSDDTKSIDISSLQNGEYILVLQSENTSITKRIVKAN